MVKNVGFSEALRIVGDLQDSSYAGNSFGRGVYQKDGKQVLLGSQLDDVYKNLKLLTEEDTQFLLEKDYSEFRNSFSCFVYTKTEKIEVKNKEISIKNRVKLAFKELFHVESDEKKIQKIRKEIDRINQQFKINDGTDGILDQCVTRMEYERKSGQNWADVLQTVGSEKNIIDVIKDQKHPDLFLKALLLAPCKYSPTESTVTFALLSEDTRTIKLEDLQEALNTILIPGKNIRLFSKGAKEKKREKVQSMLSGLVPKKAGQSYVLSSTENTQIMVGVELEDAAMPVSDQVKAADIRDGDRQNGIIRFPINAQTQGYIQFVQV